MQKSDLRTGTSSRRRLLVIDDDTAVRDSLKRALEDAGYAVALAQDGVEGLRMLDLLPPDLLVLDLNLPGQSGWELLERVRSESPLLPVIVITGMSGQFEATSLQGAAALFEKPLEMAVLLERIAQLVNEPVAERVRRVASCERTLGVHEAGAGYLQRFTK